MGNGALLLAAAVLAGGYSFTRSVGGIVPKSGTGPLTDAQIRDMADHRERCRKGQRKKWRRHKTRRQL